jgi:dTDP-4-amino-4,6-dideoxygalactose transaminase
MLNYGRHNINDEDIKSVVEALKSDWLTIGPLVEKFEEKLSEFTGAPTISVSSGTAALHSAFAAINLQPGDEVISPPLTFIATQATSSLFNAKTVFADIEDEYGHIDPIEVERKITSRTKAIVAVDYSGNPADLDALLLLKNKYGLYLIEDAAHSFGSLYKNKNVGSISDLTTFSFFPTKNFTTGEGGAISSNHPDLLEKARLFSRQGIVRDKTKFKNSNEGPWHQEVQSFGLNYRLPDILCALGISQLRRAEEFKNQKMNIVETYNSELGDFKGIRLPKTREECSVNWHLYPIRVESSIRRELFEHLLRQGIKAQINYLPAHMQPVFNIQKYDSHDFPVSYKFYSEEISVPLFAGMTDEQVHLVVKTLKGFFRNL